MSIKKSEKTSCKYCKKILSDPHEIELNYHKDCFESFKEFEKNHQTIQKQLAKALDLSKKRIVDFIKDKKIQYTLNDTGKIIELKISKTHVKSFHLSVSELVDLQILSFSNHFTHEEYVDSRTPYTEEGFYKPEKGMIKLPEDIGNLKNLEKLIYQAIV